MGLTALSSSLFWRMDDDYRYGQLALDSRLITPDQFDAAMEQVKSTHVSMSEVSLAVASLMK